MLVGVCAPPVHRVRKTAITPLEIENYFYLTTAVYIHSSWMSWYLDVINDFFELFFLSRFECRGLTLFLIFYKIHTRSKM